MMKMAKRVFEDAERWLNVVRISKDVFQVNSQRSENIFHYVRRSKAFNGPVEVEYFCCFDCPAYQYRGSCWHLSEVSRVYDRDPNYDHEITAEKYQAQEHITLKPKDKLSYEEDDYSF